MYQSDCPKQGCKNCKSVAVVAVVTAKILHLVIRYFSLKIYNLFLKFVANS